MIPKSVEPHRYICKLKSNRHGREDSGSATESLERRHAGINAASARLK